MENQIEFTRINNDINGNSRFVAHYLNFQTKKERESVLPFPYELTLKRAKKIGGKKFHNKQYGGGIVFQSYSIPETIKSIQELLNELENEKDKANCI